MCKKLFAAILKQNVPLGGRRSAPQSADAVIVIIVDRRPRIGNAVPLGPWINLDALIARQPCVGTVVASVERRTVSRKAATSIRLSSSFFSASPNSGTGSGSNGHKNRLDVLKKVAQSVLL